MLNHGKIMLTTLLNYVRYNLNQTYRTILYSTINEQSILKIEIFILFVDMPVSDHLLLYF